MTDSSISATSNAAVVTLTTTTESVVVLTDILSSVSDAGEGKLVNATVALTPGTAATAATLRVRRGSGITGTIVQTVVRPVTAAVADAVSILALDNPAAPSSQYAVTLQMTAATANTTVAAGAAVASAADVTPLSP